MLIYVTLHETGKQYTVDKAKQITHDLQTKDFANCYICPLTAFSHLGVDEVWDDMKIALRLDLLSLCDVLIVASKVDRWIKQEIEFAELVGMEVRYIEKP